MKEFTEAQLRSMSLFATWWSMVEAGRELDGDPRIPDDAIILNYSGNGASCFVTAGDIREIVKAFR